jgi:hypothetical protein
LGSFVVFGVVSFGVAYVSLKRGWCFMMKRWVIDVTWVFTKVRRSVTVLEIGLAEMRCCGVRKPSELGLQ